MMNIFGVNSAESHACLRLFNKNNGMK